MSELLTEYQAKLRNMGPEYDEWRAVVDEQMLRAAKAEERIAELEAGLAPFAALSGFFKVGPIDPELIVLKGVHKDCKIAYKHIRPAALLALPPAREAQGQGEVQR